MAQMDDSKLFSCPKCETQGAIIFLKAEGNKIIVKQKCPKHGVRSFNIPLMQKNRFIPHFRDGVFRCYQCGQETTVISSKASGPWMLIKCACPTHGNKLPLQRIWSTVYTDISNKDAPAPQSVQPQSIQPQPAPSDEKKFCPNCGTPLSGTDKHCDACGSEIN
ncbi:MAG: hypothetical protein E3J52_01730 [Promethearchaeota archaeon]|nr:MAG: hypothetical protein E3J52_01730 [Candidatus Lokiarchaeota archaeon]